MGMMPSSEVKIEKQFKVGASQLIVTIQSGEKGWAVKYADGSSDYKDELDTAENNYSKALKVLNYYFDNINEILK